MSQKTPITQVKLPDGRTLKLGSSSWYLFDDGVSIRISHSNAELLAKKPLPKPAKTIEDLVGSMVGFNFDTREANRIAKTINRDLDDAKINKAKGKGGQKRGYGKTHPEAWAAAVAFYRVEYEKGPLTVKGALINDPDRPTRFFAAMQPYVEKGLPDDYLSSQYDFAKKAALTARKERLTKN